ncbi:hypothetical protein ACFRCI_23465 [Streptomyces sp. NPDC056638]|uniref:hypothetical protein n=1 Tax=Streptomyces sp. NPDC056638 TaxID=3345887 RepID=UPI003699F267
MFIKIEYGSSHNISVQGIEYFEVHPDELDDEGNVPEDLIGATWQHAVNEFMDDTSATLVGNEGD